LSAPCVRRLSADGRGAIAVVEVRGRGALERVKALASGTALAPGELRLLALRDGDQVLDRALVAVLAEDELELHLHGNPSLVERVLAALGGETQSDTAQGLERAALELLADAPCEAAARLLLDQAEGALRRELELLLELPDEQARAGLDTLLERARVARFALRPARVLLRGPVNAGKSTLFNALHASERVLVSEQAGTTRDVVRERVQLGEWPVELWDTPGEREQGAPASRALELERAGLALARGNARPRGGLRRPARAAGEPRGRTSRPVAGRDLGTDRSPRCGAHGRRALPPALRVAPVGLEPGRGGAFRREPGVGPAQRARGASRAARGRAAATARRPR
jgi:tRNA modification GTPase